MIKSNGFRIPLSVPVVGDEDRLQVAKALDSGWLAPAGPTIAAFEHSVAEACGSRYAVAVSSGTAALHLALLAAGIQREHRVVVPTLTFAASAFPVTYVGAEPVFIDVDSETWCIDLTALETFLKSSRLEGRPVQCVISVDLFGRMPDYPRLLELAQEYEFTLIEDAAEAMGSTMLGRPAGSWGEIRAMSFNGNKIVTAGGGGAVLTDSEAVANRVRKLATQARTDVHWFEHDEVGFNYRLSNVQAAVGIGQISRLQEFVEHRRAINDLYRKELHGVQGITVISDTPGCVSNCWLTNILLPEPGDARVIVERLHCDGIEARMNWKPMHQQPVFASTATSLNSIADDLFQRGICLPSGSGLSESDVKEVCTALLESF